MLENSFGITFFLKSSVKSTKEKYIYLRITVDGVPKETSTKRKWDFNRWEQKTARATGNKEDAKALNLFLNSLELKINKYRDELSEKREIVSSVKLINYALGKTTVKSTVLQEFQLHNDQMLALVEKEEYAIGTHERYEISKKHVTEFMFYKYGLRDMEFSELNFEFVKDYEFYLKTVKNISNNTALKYISNFKKVVLIGVDKEIISADPFKRFKSKKIKVPKKPLTNHELSLLEKHKFLTDRLSVVRDVFVFQCYTGLAYIDVFNLKQSDLKFGIDQEKWIMSARQKTKNTINVPLLPKAIEIIESYKNHPLCIQRNSVLPVSSNQKMNEYLKEIADLCGIRSVLNTHKARRTFASTVTLNNNVPIHVVKEMLGHQSVSQTEGYAITEELTIGREMQGLKQRLEEKQGNSVKVTIETIEKMEQELIQMKKSLGLKS
ncbi:site-specific integrase [Flavobacterium sp. LHD-80]|uniref:site-specific integrase n=1 Tax=Flavobacterium sp. LHD-80 TaxID=3071411 RepID=UPI0027E0FB33|nr:site-specific integrase [Flavobacterium sp. LHD-80]MDQ6470628.1 site-specific integrase [Flavobacterium sp. LHD-80]